MDDRQHYLRELPAVDRLLREPPLDNLSGSFPRGVVLEAVQETVERYRSLIMNAAGEGELAELDLTAPALALEAAARLQQFMEPSLRPVINATGIILHTNLGRALLADEAVQAVAGVASSYCNLEIFLDSGKRGSRQAHLEELLCRFSGAEAAVVVNNNAAAVFLVLNTVAKGKEVIVSRGQLVEIGGSFRIPEVMSASGARLVEVGTTNKTHLKDYREAITGETAALLKVHTSNYQIVGFASQVEAEQMVKLAGEHGLLVIEDLGSGVFLDLARFGLPAEPRVQDSIAAGVDLVTFSGDKLLGGPQAGIIVGRRELVEQVRNNQLARALRVDKFTVAALEATLRLYLGEEEVVKKIPVWRMLTADPDYLHHRARSLMERLKDIRDFGLVELQPGTSRVGGGALPLAELPTTLVSLYPSRVSVTDLAARLRHNTPPVIVRVQQDRLMLDVRTIKEEETDLVVEAIRRHIK